MMKMTKIWRGVAAAEDEWMKTMRWVTSSRGRRVGELPGSGRVG